MKEEEKKLIEDILRDASVSEWVEMSERIGDVATMRSDSDKLLQAIWDNGMLFSEMYCTRRKRPV